MIGSLVWGWLGDVIGRRASILLAGILFVATSICGAMPSYQWNFFMCFLMGLGAGGMLPGTVTLVAELMPRRHRAWATVIIGGELALAYVLTSWAASELTPTYSWRILWFLGLPTGVLLIALQQFIPESPRFLLQAGRTEEAREVLRRYGADAVLEPGPEPLAEQLAVGPERGPRIASYLAVAALGLGAGLVTYGFQLWIPSSLQNLGFTQATSAGFLRDSALIGLPVTLIVAALYTLWSARGAILALTLLTTTALVGFAVAGNAVVAHRTLLHALLVVPTAAINSVLAVALTAATEVFPTRTRGRATGTVAGLSKAGGVLLTALVVAAVAPASIRVTALLGAVPLAAGAVALLSGALETRHRSLDELELVAGQPI